MLISSNKILLSKASENISIYQEDTIVDLSFNFLTEIPGELLNLENLDKCFLIDLSGNRIHSKDSWHVLRILLYTMQNGFVKITKNPFLEFENEARALARFFPDIFARVIWIEERNIDNWEFIGLPDISIKNSHKKFYEKYNQLMEKYTI